MRPPRRRRPRHPRAAAPCGPARRMPSLRHSLCSWSLLRTPSLSPPSFSLPPPPSPSVSPSLSAFLHFGSEELSRVKFHPHRSWSTATAPHPTPTLRQTSGYASDQASCYVDPERLRIFIIIQTVSNFFALPIRVTLLLVKCKYLTGGKKPRFQNQLRFREEHSNCPASDGIENEIAGVESSVKLNLIFFPPSSFSSACRSTLRSDS